MYHHQNARLTVHSREQLARKVLARGDFQLRPAAVSGLRWPAGGCLHRRRSKPVEANLLRKCFSLRGCTQDYTECVEGFGMTESSKQAKTPRTIAMDSHPEIRRFALNVLNTNTDAKNPFLQQSNETQQVNKQSNQQSIATDKSDDSSSK